MELKSVFYIYIYISNIESIYTVIPNINFVMYIRRTCKKRMENAGSYRLMSKAYAKDLLYSYTMPPDDSGSHITIIIFY